MCPVFWPHPAHTYPPVTNPCPGHRLLWTRAPNLESGTEPRQPDSRVGGRHARSFFLYGSYWACQLRFQNRKLRPASDKHSGLDYVGSGRCWDATATGDPHPALALTGHDRPKGGQGERTAVGQVVGPRGCETEKPEISVREDRQTRLPSLGYPGRWGGGASFATSFPPVTFQSLHLHCMPPAPPSTRGKAGAL